jgi:hypothetical protein
MSLASRFCGRTACSAASRLETPQPLGCGRISIPPPGGRGNPVTGPGQRGQRVLGQRPGRLEGREPLIEHPPLTRPPEDRHLAQQGRAWRIRTGRGDDRGIRQ